MRCSPSFRIWLFAVCVPGAFPLAGAASDEPSDPLDLFRRGLGAIAERRLVEAQDLLERFLDTSSSKRHREERRIALRELLRAGELLETRARRRQHALRRLIREFPLEAHARGAHQRLEKLQGWRFASVPDWAPTGRRTMLQVHHWGAERKVRFAVYRVPSRFRSADRGEDWKDRVRELSGDRQRLESEGWIEVSRATSAEWEASLDLEAAPPGRYALEERYPEIPLSIFHPLEIRSFSLLARGIGRQALVWLADVASGQPVAGARVKVERNGEAVAGGFTGEDGQILLELPAAPGEEDDSVDVEHWSVVGWRGDEVRRVDLETCGYPASEPSRVFITTDRPIYRPGDTVRFKAVRRDVLSGELHLPAREPVRVEVRDPRGRILWQDDPTWSEAGSVTGSFELGPEPPLGGYCIVVRVEHSESPLYFDWIDEEPLRWWSKSFAVEAYRKPELEVLVVARRDDSGAAARILGRIEARYFHGGPVPDAEVRWMLLRVYEEELEERGIPRPPLDDPRAWFYERSYARAEYWSDEEELFLEDFESPAPSEDAVPKGSGTTGADGVVELEIPLPSGGGDFELVASVRDRSRLAAEGRTWIEQKRAATIRVATDRLFYMEGDTMGVQVRLTDAHGKPLQERQVEVVVFQVRLAEDSVELESFHRVEGRTGADGLARVEVPASRSGTLHFLARARGSDGKVYEDRTEVESVNLDVPPASDKRVSDATALAIRVVPDRVLYEPGETLRLLVRSAAAGPGLLTVEGERLLHCVPVLLVGRNQVVELPVTREWVPSVVLRAFTSVRGEVEEMSCEVFVSPVDRFIDVTVTPDRASYAPGEKARIALSTRAAGGPVASEVDLTVVDEAVFQLLDDSTEDIRSFFYPLPEWSHGPMDLSERARYALHQPTLRLVSFAEEPGQAPFLAPARLRRHFPDTLFWSGRVVTDGSGRAEVEVAMPDSLTEWRVLARAVSGPDRFGSGVSRMLSRKDVVLRLATPRFLTEGDSATIAVVLHNRLEREEMFHLDFDAPGAAISLAAAGSRELRLGSGGEARLD